MATPVISVSQMREWEKAAWAAGKNESEVMDCVGGLVARRARELAGGGPVLVLAGKGHNGEDARRASEQLADLRVRVCNVSNPDEAWKTLINRINSAQARVLSVDVPSGLNADTGEPEGAAIRASVTLTLGAM